MAFCLTARIGDQELRYQLGPGEYVIGSSREAADIVLADPTVSRRHARLAIAGDEARLTDLGSSNGTRINDQPLDGETVVGDGDRIAIAGIPLRCELVPDADLDIWQSAEGTATSAADTLTGQLSTLDSDPLRRFCTHHLSGLVRRLARGRPDTDLAAAIAEALADSAVQVEFRILRDGALLASAGKAAGDLLFRDHARNLALEVRYGDADQAADLRALGRLALDLFSLRTVTEAEAPAPRSPGEPPELPAPLTQHQGLREIYQQAARIAAGPVSVLIEGESGTGKELLARYVHASSGLPADRLVTLNCASLPKDLLEAELFGIEAGVATGVQARPGLFELADGGTLLLDEVGDMALDTQARILRVLQEKEVFRVGGSRPRSATVRVIAATNKSMQEMVDEGAFRLDLYHRIADWTVRLPPLRERTEDIPNLAAHFLARECAARGIRYGGISEAALDCLKRYRWPGNVRELEREMLRVSLFLNDGEALSSTMLQERIRSSQAAHDTARDLNGIVGQAERDAIREALDATGGKVSAAAKRLGVSRATIYRRIQELGIDLER